MKEKIQSVILGCLAVGFGYLHIFLVRVRILSPTPDPFIMPWEENK